MNQIPGPGEKYRHFKNKLYQIVAVAAHFETGEQMVVCQALYGDYGVWVCPLSVFLEPVDREKYPEAVQEYQFERVRPAGKITKPARADAGLSEPETEAVKASFAETRQNPPAGEPGKSALHPLFFEFLDTDSYEKRLALLQAMKGKVGQREVDSLCVCLDLQPGEGNTEDQLEHIKQYMKTQQRYNTSRLRRS